MEEQLMKEKKRIESNIRKFEVLQHQFIHDVQSCEYYGTLLEICKEELIAFNQKNRLVLK